MIKTTNGPGGDGNPKWHQFQRHLALKGNQKKNVTYAIYRSEKSILKDCLGPNFLFLCCSGEDSIYGIPYKQICVV